VVVGKASTWSGVGAGGNDMDMKGVRKSPFCYMLSINNMHLAGA
jgi:hypothetical protein